MIFLANIIFILIGYFIGSILFADVLSKITKENIRSFGSKNPGATNAGRKFGAKGFIFVFVGDGLKCICAFVICFLLSKYVIFFEINANPYISVFGVIMGHCFSIYHKFKGGKGMACFSAGLLIFNPLLVLICIICFISTLKISKNVAMSSCISTVISTIMAMIMLALFLDNFETSRWFCFPLWQTTIYEINIISYVIIAFNAIVVCCCHFFYGKINSKN